MKQLPKYAFLFFSIALLQSCATSTNLVNKTEIAMNQDRDKVITTLVNQAKSCWAKSYSTFGGDAWVVDHLSYGMTVSRWAPDLDYENTRPVLRLRVMKDGENSRVYVSEGECGSMCSYDSFTADIKRWLDGDLRCKLPK